jgi:VIT1/CCC1 family predicted Fe2+/Mn2+ transporter
MVVSDLRLALRLSGAVAVAMLFGCGFALGRHTGVSPWAAGLSTVALGGVLVGVAVLLGG